MPDNASPRLQLVNKIIHIPGSFWVNDVLKIIWWKGSKNYKWKLDQTYYNVLYIGTSAYKRATGQVQKGKRPISFIDAYLEQSPKAV